MKKNILLTLALLSVYPALFAQNPLIEVYRVSLTGNESTCSPVQPYSILQPGKINFVTFSMMFWACPPCVSEIRGVNDSLKALVDQGKVVYSVVATTPDSSTSDCPLLRVFAKERKWAFPLYLDLRGGLVDAIRVGNGFPISMLSDTNGTVRYQVKAGLSTKERLSEIRQKAQSLTSITYQLYDFSLPEISRLLTGGVAQIRQQQTFLAGKGFFEMEKSKFSIVDNERNLMELTLHDTSQMAGKTALVIFFSKKSQHDSLREKCIRDGYTSVSSADESEVYKKSNMTLVFSQEQSTPVFYKVRAHLN